MRTLRPALWSVLVLAAFLARRRGARARWTGWWWALNRQISEFPRELGFSATFVSDELGPAAGRRGDALEPPRVPRLQTQTEDDSRRVRFLTDEMRLPPDRLTIAVTPATVTLTPDRGAVRTIQPGKRDDSVNLGPMTAVVNAAWEEHPPAGRLPRRQHADDPLYLRRDAAAAAAHDRRRVHRARRR